MSELKPCPFCGGEATRHFIKTLVSHVKCKNDKCICGVLWVGDIKWNTRTQSQCNEKIKRGIRVALRNLGNADIDEDSIEKFADDYVSSLPPKEQGQ